MGIRLVALASAADIPTNINAEMENREPAPEIVFINATAIPAKNVVIK